MLRLRPYKPCDGNKIAGWIVDEKTFAMWSACHYDYPLTGEQITARMNDSSDNTCEWMMTALDEGGEPVGYFLLRNADYKNNTIRMGFIVVDSSKRGKGYGSQMLELAKKYCFEVLGIDRISLGAFELNERAIKCYEKAGFRECGKWEADFEFQGERWSGIDMECYKAKRNPWNEIDLNDYESHMKLDSVAQLQAMNEMMYGQLYDYNTPKVMILGIAGGNGLNHIDAAKINKVYGVDINGKYLQKCRERFRHLGDTLATIQADLTDKNTNLPHVDMLMANLLLEYVGYDSFVRNINQIEPNYVSVIIQINESDGFVSDSPYLHSFDRLDEVYHHIDGDSLTEIMDKAGYCLIKKIKKALPNGKALERLDFSTKDQGDFT